MPRPLVVVLLTAFVLLDGFLIALALRNVSGDPSASPDGGAAATQSSGELSAQTSYEPKPAEAMSLSAADDNSVISGVRGSCEAGEPGRVRTSLDGGRKFIERSTGLVEVLNVEAVGDGTFVAVGAGRTDPESGEPAGGCGIVQSRSTDSGRTWTFDDRVTLWHLSATDKLAVVSPETTKGPPTCVPIALSRLSDKAAYTACSDGRVYLSTDAARSWMSVQRIDNIRAIGFESPTKGYALARFQGCAAFSFRTNDGGDSWTPGECVGGDRARAIAASARGPLALVDSPALTYYYDTVDEAWKRR